MSAWDDDPIATDEDLRKLASFGRRPGRREPAEISHVGLIADAIEYHAGRHGCGYEPAAWDEQASRWMQTPRGLEALQRMAGPLRAALVEPDARPFRWMPDGTPCWCISADEPHEGWIHAPACQAALRERVAIAIAKLQAQA